MSFRKRLYLFKKLLPPLLLIGALIIVGIVGYMVIEDYAFLEAVYMTVITIGSVGFMEVHPLNDAGRIFTIFLILVNIGIFTYFITLMSRYFFDLEFIKKYNQLKMEKKIEQLHGHVIICGFGRNGKESAQVLHDNKIPFVVLEEKNELDPNIEFAVPHFLKGDGTKDEALIEAGIKKARAIITTLPVDADNLFVVLSAKQLNPNIAVISRASQDSSVNKLKIAGADNVIMPDKIGGAHMATLVMQPDVVELLSIMGTMSNEQFRIAELVAATSVLLGDLDLWGKTNCTILGIKNHHKHYDINPPVNYQISAGESLIVMGSDEQISKAKMLVC
jgi:voltage-gated potassium channel